MFEEVEKKKKIITDYSNLTIGYMLNPDKVFYNEIDFEIIKNLENLGAKVEMFNLEEVYFSMKKDEIEVFIKNEKVNWKGFLSYGYCSKFHFEAYLLMISAFEHSNIPTLHKREQENILNNKLLQALSFSKAGINIPDTHIGFGIPSFKYLVNSNYPKGGIYKKLDDYGGDGVFKIESADGLITSGAKCLWKNEYCIFQKFVPDCLGKSVRVLCINGKTVAISEYNDKTKNFRSNVNYSFELFSLDSLMNSEKYDQYAQIAESAIKSLGGLTIGGVDILDSDSHGLVVLEVNGWPDIYDISSSTGVKVFELFADAYLRKCLTNKIL
jgi:ribosomal protein S6--L-glutamate ligase